jgi:hypothetical protein
MMRSCFLLLLAAVNVFAQSETIVVDPALHHLGQKETKTFPVDLQKPEGVRLDRSFEAKLILSEATLRLEQRDVTDDCAIELNGSRIARLNIVTPSTTSHFAIPPGLLKEGTNSLSIVPSNPADEIIVGKIEIVPQPLRDAQKLGHVTVNVAEGVGPGMPARITIANREGIFADIYNVQPSSAAWRNGIIYTTGAPVEFDLPEGEWGITATRGMEWSRAATSIRLFIGRNLKLNLPLARQVDTTGYIAADTHLHTYTFSGHGDASVDERVASLAGEGVELAIATDHNHITDYKPRQNALALSSYFTAVSGNEVTTSNGHFNAFPFALEAKKPDHKETNWVRLVENIRSKGAQYVILNHPRWPAITNSPMAIWGLNRADGSRTNEMPFTVDAMEIINSTVPLKEANFSIRDWFAVLSRGERIWGVGSSDTHTVHDVPGQGRTYIPSATDDPAAIDVKDAIKKMQAGNMSISYGIFATATANGAHMGQITSPSTKSIDVNFHVACANWITATQAVVYLNGLKVSERNISLNRGFVLATNLNFRIAVPTEDAFIVCVAYGEGVKDPSWPTYANYTFAVTNPIFIDADKDGKYRSPRETAVALLAKMKPFSLAKVQRAIETVDAAIAVQILTETKLRLPAGQIKDWNNLVEKLPAGNEIFDLYRASISGF